MPEVEDWEHLIVVTAIHGERFLGWLPPAGDAKEYVADCITRKIPLELHNVRTLLTQIQPDIGADGRLRGASKAVMLTPIDLVPGYLPMVYIRDPSTWYFPSDYPICKTKFEEMLKSTMASEAMAAAEEAGLVLPKTPKIRGH